MCRKMLYIFAMFCIMMSAGHKVSKLKMKGEDLAELKWPERYMVQATQMTLSSGLVEDFTAWKTINKSRVDYNHGAMKRITLMSSDLSDGDKYEIHPETTETEYNTIKCDYVFQLKVDMDSILPDLDDVSYESVGNEIVSEKETVKFESIEEDNEKQRKNIKTIWALYEVMDNGEEGWTPVRYEAKAFSSKRGALMYHSIYEYTEFSVIFADDVFETDLFECKKYNKHDGNSEAVTKDLFFIDPENPQHVDHVFKSFQNKFERQYTDDHDLRRSLFQDSMRLISSVNRQNLGYKLSINEFADRTSEEMKGLTGLYKRPEGKVGNIPFPYTETTLEDAVSGLPKEFDLRLLGFISPVKHQGTCGSCWAFGTTAAVEGALARANGGRLMSLASQAIIDCAWDAAHGCSGGTDNAAYEWMMEHGLPTEEEYGPYANRDGYCNIKNMTKLYPIRGYTDVTPGSTKALKVALVNHGPLSVSVHASHAFKLYSSGIFYEAGCDSKRLNHEVALVGYGESDGETFWILKNSWGAAWGVDGYMYIAAQNNNCGVETEPTYAVL